MAAYGPDELERLFEDSRIVRNRCKIIATVENARIMLDYIDEHGSFHAYLRSLGHLDYHTRVKVLTRPFAGLGRTSPFRVSPLRQRGNARLAGPVGLISGPL